MAYSVFPFNPFQANTYLWADASGDCIMIDATFQTESELSQVLDWIKVRGLNLKMLLVTHYHVDHVVGVGLFKEKTGLPVMAHQAGNLFFNQVEAHAASFGLRISGNFMPTGQVSDDELISVGGSTIRVLYTPGHADGSICLWIETDGLLFTGDVLFHESIGRTDLPTGDFQTLANSVTTKLFPLPDNTIVLPGHGPKTSVGHEKRFNPFL